MSPLKKILFVISSLQGGGAERVVCAMANHWADKGHDVTILTLAGPEVEIAYPLLPSVKKEALGVLGKSSNALSDNINRIKKIRHVFKTQRPDVIMSFMESTNVLSLLAAWRTGVNVIISDRVDPKFYSYGRIWRVLRGFTYPFASEFIVQTKVVLNRYPSLLARKASVIPNFVAVIEGDAGNKKPENSTICAMGRLNRQKGFDILLAAFAKIASQCPDWSLEIWGEGAERQSLEALRDSLGLSERVSFPGFSKNAAEVMKSASLFVLPSRYEGFPNALMEAMACGLPVIATKCPCGPEEIIQNEHNGLLVPTEDVDALAEALTRLIGDQTQREKLGKAAQKVRDDYGVERIIGMWEEKWK